MARLDSRLEAEGAEFLVCGHLLIEGIPAYKSYTNTPGYDLVAVNPDNNSSARIQVKSRWATDLSKGFILRNFDTDFIVFAALNRGFRRRSTSSDSGKREPEFFVFPVEVARAGLDPKSHWGRVERRLIPEVDIYRGRWDLIRMFLALSDPHTQTMTEAGETRYG